eukprot:4020459-Amphidinium_carterae.1
MGWWVCGGSAVLTPPTSAHTPLHALGHKARWDGWDEGLWGSSPERARSHCHSSYSELSWCWDWTSTTTVQENSQ